MSVVTTIDPNPHYHSYDTFPNGTVIFRNEKGEIHRLGYPAIEGFDGTTEWYLNGVRHRDKDADGILQPAIDSPLRTEWWEHGVCLDVCYRTRQNMNSEG